MHKMVSSEKAPCEKRRHATEEQWSAQSRLLNEQCSSEFKALTDKHAKEIVLLQEEQAKQVAALEASKGSVLEDRRATFDAEIRVIMAKFHPTIMEAQKESDALAKTLGVKRCEFCGENILADKTPKWNKKWRSIHCGNCPMGRCPYCHEPKLQPECSQSKFDGCDRTPLPQPRMHYQLIIVLITSISTNANAASILCGVVFARDLLPYRNSANI